MTNSGTLSMTMLAGGEHESCKIHRIRGRTTATTEEADMVTEGMTTTPPHIGGQVIFALRVQLVSLRRLSIDNSFTGPTNSYYFGGGTGAAPGGTGAAPGGSGIGATGIPGTDTPDNAYYDSPVEATTAAAGIPDPANHSGGSLENLDDPVFGPDPVNTSYDDYMNLPLCPEPSPVSKFNPPPVYTSAKAEYVSANHFRSASFCNANTTFCGGD